MFTQGWVITLPKYYENAVIFIALPSNFSLYRNSMDILIDKFICLYLNFGIHNKKLYKKPVVL